MRCAAAAVAALFVATTTACGAEGGSNGACSPVATTPDLGGDHIAAGASAPIRSFPPASGPHDPRPLPAGIYNLPLTTQPSGSAASTIYRAVHSLEHGYIVVLHDGLPAVDVQRLRDRYEGKKKVIVVPARGLSARVTILAWRRVQTCPGVDSDAIDAFIEAFREKAGPEPDGP